MKTGPFTFVSMRYTDGKECTFDVCTGYLRGPKSNRYFDHNAKDTQCIAIVSMCSLRNPMGFVGLYRTLAYQHAPTWAPPVEWYGGAL